VIRRLNHSTPPPQGTSASLPRPASGPQPRDQSPYRPMEPTSFGKPITSKAKRPSALPKLQSLKPPSHFSTFALSDNPRVSASRECGAKLQITPPRLYPDDAPISVGPDRVRKAHLPRLPRNVDSQEQLARPRNLHLFSQKTVGRSPSAITDRYCCRPSHQISAGLILYSQSGVILHIEGVSKLISTHHWEGRDTVVLGHSVRRTERVLQSNRYTVQLVIECSPYQTIAG